MWQEYTAQKVSETPNPATFTASYQTPTLNSSVRDLTKSNSPNYHKSTKPKNSPPKENPKNPPIQNFTIYEHSSAKPNKKKTNTFVQMKKIKKTLTSQLPPDEQSLW